MGHYQLSPDVYVELFGEEAVLFIAEEDRLITVNAASADLYKKIRVTFGLQPFAADEIVSFLCSTFHIGINDAVSQVRRLLTFGLRQGLVSKSSEKRESDE
jgi:hypothetical protein